MFMDTPQDLLILTVGAFALGWLVAKVGGFLGRKVQASGDRDPRDDRIRSLEMDLRVARGDGDKLRAEVESGDKELKEARAEIDRLEQVVAEQADQVQRLRVDLRDSVRKTRELRAELTDRAEENLRSEVKLREVETELSVAQASTDLMSTGVLDYSMAPDGPNEDEDESVPRPASR